MPQETRRHPFRRQLTVLTLSRLLINTAIRLTYPFLPALARGAGISITDASRLVALRGAVGLSSPLFSPLSNRYGRRFALVLAMLIFAVGDFAVVLRPTYWFLAAMFIMSGLTKVIFDPAAQTYLGETVPYHQRGRAIAILELSWAGALLLGAPAVGFIMEKQGWSAPFAWLGILSLIALFALWRVMPAGPPAESGDVKVKAMLGVVRRHPIIWAVSLYTMLLMAGNEVLLIVFGVWFEEQFALSIASLGLAAGIIGVSELIGELSVGQMVDRLGKRPVIISSALLTTLCYLAVPFVGYSLVTAVAMLFLLFLAYEITVVGGIPLLTEVLPQSRSTLLSMSLAAASVGRMAGALIGPVVWMRFGLIGVCLTAALFTIVAILVLFVWIREAPASRVAQVEAG